jgi:hypothetical protein
LGVCLIYRVIVERGRYSDMRAEEDLTDVHGVGKITAERLNEAGISSFAELAYTAPEELSEVTGFPLSRVVTVQNAAKKLLESLPTAAPPVVPDSEKPRKKKDKAKKKLESGRKKKKKDGGKKAKRKKDGKKKRKKAKKKKGK